MLVMVVEDEALVGMMMEDYLLDLGHEVACIVPSVAEAMQVIDRGEIDIAILDVNLSGETSYPVADRLRNLGVPFAFATGYGRGGVDLLYRDVPVLQKPFDESILEEVVDQLSREKV
jgi:CheY-like chemotaxis protein